MTEYKKGQRVRIEWPDGSAVEGLLHEPTDEYFTVKVKGAGFSTLDPGDGRVVTVLAEPRLAEPTGFGAVVEADVNEHRGMVRPGRRRWTSNGNGWISEDAPTKGNACWVWAVVWEDLIDPVILSEGWTPPPTSHGMADVYNLAECHRCGHTRRAHSLPMSGCSVCSCSEFEL